MLWMERVAISFYMILIFFSALILFVFNSYFHWELDDVIQILIKLPFITCLILWAFFRLTDFLCGGPLRRKIKKESDNCQYLQKP